MREERVFWVGVACFTLLALATRVLYLEQFSLPILQFSDARGYFSLGSYLAEGAGYIRWPEMLFYGIQIPTAEFPPLFPLLLAGLHLLGETSMEGQRLIISILGAQNVVWVSLLGRALTNARTGLVAGGIAAFSPALIEIDGSLMAEALYVPLMTISYILLLRALAQQSPASWLGVGAVLGLCALVRSEAFLFIPFLGLPLVWMGVRRKRWLAIAALVVGLTGVILPWTVRNAVVLGAFVPVSQSFKGVVRGANCAAAYRLPRHRGGWVLYGKQDSGKRIRRPSESESFDRSQDIGIRFMMEHLDELPGVIVARVLRTWGLYQPGHWYGLGTIEARNEEFSRRTWWVGWLLLVLAPPGLVLMWLRSPLNFGLTLAPIVVVTLTTVMAYGNVRFRAAAEPSLIVLAATSLRAGWALLRGRDWREGARLGAAR